MALTGLDIYKKLPKTNCKECGLPTCLAFAIRVYQGERAVSRCRPVFAGQAGRWKDALMEICAGLGVADEVPQDQRL